MAVSPRIDRSDFAGLVAHLGDPVRAKKAFHHLLSVGAPARDAVRTGLTDPNGDVRMYCVQVLDHLVDEGAWPALIAMLGDVDPRVRVHALHAIACDRCKDDVCPPDESDFLPAAIRILRDDPFYHVRQMAVEVVGAFVHTDSEATAALEAARDEDQAPSVRKKAGWYAPGGAIFRKTAARR